MENIQVALRVRPLSKKEIHNSDEDAWEVTNSEDKALAKRNSITAKKATGMSRSTFQYDKCFGQEDNNVQIYDQIVKRVVLSSLNGINGTVFMYGQTGSGKTYTMTGYRKEDEEEENTNYFNKASPSRGLNTLNKAGNSKRSLSNRENYVYTEQGDEEGNLITDITDNTGILIISLRDIFNAAKSDLTKTYFLKCSYIEIYNEQVFDLLGSMDKLTETLTVGEDANKGFYVKGITEETVFSIDDVLRKLKVGEANRHYAKTNMNHVSSRSHTIFRLTVQSVSSTTARGNHDDKLRSGSQMSGHANGGDETIVTESHINFVDLAGSEKISNHQMTSEDIAQISYEQGSLFGRESFVAAAKLKERVKEGQHINKSLFFLTQVISLKSEGKNNQHIPYRNSPLTKILRSSLGGNSRTLIILCVTPALSQYDQTVSTLRFGVSAKKIENKVKPNIITRDDGIEFKVMISDYEKRLRVTFICHTHYLTVQNVELAKQEEHLKFDQLKKELEASKTQRAILTERVNVLCMQKVSKMGESLEAKDKYEFFKQVREKNVYMDRIGMVFPSKALDKYDNTDFDNNDARNSLNFEFIDDEDLDGPVGEKAGKSNQESWAKGRKEPNLQSRAQVEEWLITLYLRLLKVSKEENTLLNQKVEMVVDNAEKILERCISNYRNYMEADTKYKMLENKFIAVVDNCKELADISQSLKKDVNLYKDLKDLDELDDEELEDFEKVYWKNLDKIKLERARRIIKKEMGLDSTHQVQANKKIGIGSEDIELQMQSFWEELRSLIDDEYKFKPIYEKEEEELRGIYSFGLRDIEKELEDRKRIIFEQVEDIHIVKKQRDQSKAVKNEAKFKTSTEGDKIAFGGLKLLPVEDVVILDELVSEERHTTLPENESLGKYKRALSYPKLNTSVSVHNCTLEDEAPKVPKLKIPNGSQESEQSGSNKLNRSQSANPQKLKDIVLNVSQKMGKINIKKISESLNISRRDESSSRKSLPADPKTKLNSSSFLKTFESDAEEKFEYGFSASRNLKNEEVERTRESRNNKFETDELDSVRQIDTKRSSENVLKAAKGFLNKESLRNSTSEERTSLNFELPNSKRGTSQPPRYSKNNVQRYKDVITDDSGTPSDIKTAVKQINPTGIIRKLEYQIEMESQTESDRRGNAKLYEHDDLVQFETPKVQDIPQIRTYKQPEGRKNQLLGTQSSQESEKNFKMGTNKHVLGDRSLDLANIEKEDNIFASSVLSMKEFIGKKDRDHDLLFNKKTPSQFEQMLDKSENNKTSENFGESMLNEAKKRRKRADRVAK